jgi:hypothetical protein
MDSFDAAHVVLPQLLRGMANFWAITISGQYSERYRPSRAA